MSVGFRHGDPRFPFFWESVDQPLARWHGPSEGPVQYLADTPDGAWAEFLRHEEITDVADLAGIVRRLWTVELPDDVGNATDASLPDDIARGGLDSYPACQEEARKLRANGATVIRAPSAALLPGAARGQVTQGGLREAPAADGLVWVLVGARPEVRGWVAADNGQPPERLLPLVAHFSDTPPRGRDRRRGGDRRFGC